MFEHSVGLVVLLAASVAETPAPAALLQAADAPRQVMSEGVMRLRATVRRPGAATAETDLDVYVAQPDRVLCVFRTGAFEGRRILMDGGRVWLLLPGTTHPVRISPNQRLLGGASIADVARLHFAEQFTAELEPGAEIVDDVPCHKLKLSGHSGMTAYAAGTLWVGAADRLPRRAILTLPSGKPAKELRFAAYGDAGGRKVLNRLEIHHLVPAEKGMVTTLEFLSYQARRLPDGAFDPRAGREVVP